MEAKSIINCPKCGTEINVNEVLYHKLQEQIKKDFEAKSAIKEKELEEKLKAIDKEKEKIQKERENLKDIVEREVKQKLKSEKESIEKSIREQIRNETSEQIKELQKELENKSNQVKELNKIKAEIERLKREKEEQREQILLEKEKEFSEMMRNEKIKIQKQFEEANILKIKEKEKIIEDLKTQLDDAKRKAEQGSVQLQGEIQEIEIENLLRMSFPFDIIERPKKGQRGADILHIVRTNQGIECGKIYYESKRTKNFDYNWIKKLREDNLNLNINADFLVLVTETMPGGAESFFLKNGVWICSFFVLKSLSFVFRHFLLDQYSNKITQQGKESKKEMLYNYLTSNEFKAQFEAIVEGFKTLQQGHNDEKIKMWKIWKEREKQLEKILINIVNFYVSFKDIAGSSIPEVKMLESEKTNLLEE